MELASDAAGSPMQVAAVLVLHGHVALTDVRPVVLTAVTGALHRLLHSRGEIVDRLVISIPVSARRATTASQLGNQVGIIPVELPASGDPWRRLTAIARITGERKTAARGASAAVLAPAFRLLARVGILRWFVQHQRGVNTFVTNLRGPETGQSFLGADVTAIIPVSLITGNVTVAFAVLSYAGELVITIIVDPQRCQTLPRSSRTCAVNLRCSPAQQTRPLTTGTTRTDEDWFGAA